MNRLSTIDTTKNCYYRKTNQICMILVRNQTGWRHQNYNLIVYILNKAQKN